MVGKRLSHYAVLESLGSGAMGEVYRARDERLQRDVAIKVLPEELAEDADRLARLEREAHLLAAVNHPHIASIHSLEEDAGTRFLVLELIAGQSLAEKISSRLPIDEALELCGQIAEALEAAHGAGIIHRDLKPANIMVTPDRRVKVLDFGVAKEVDSRELMGATAQLTELTGTGMIVGTPPYMSPEQIRGQALDKRADIWAFGCVLYETLTGKRAFERETVGDTLAAILEHEPDWQALPANTPAVVDALLRRCLQKDPQMRLRDIGDAWVEISEVIGTSPGVRSTWQTSGGHRSRTALRYVGYVAAVAVVLAIGAFALDRLGGLSDPIQPGPTSAATHRQVTFAGDASAAAISPDGASVVYVRGEAGAHQRLMLADLAGGQPIEIFDADELILPEWSPDGSAILVSALKDGLTPARVYRIPRLGGDSRRLSPGVFTTWAPDGTTMAFALVNAGFFTFSESAGQSPFMARDGYDFNRGLRWAPTADRLAVVGSISETGTFELFTVDPDGGRRISVVRLPDPMASPRWAPEGDAIYFLRHRNNIADLLRVDLSAAGEASAPPVVVIAGLPITQSYNAVFSLTADGRTAVYSTLHKYTNLWLAELPVDGSDQQVELRQLTTGTALLERPSVSPDGQWIAYSAQATSGSNIFKMPIGGGDPIQLTFADAYQTSPAWSPDGDSIVFTHRDDDGATVWQMNADGSEPREFPDTDVSADGMTVVWAPGERPLYQGPGNQNFFYLDVTTGATEPLVPETAFEARSEEPRGYTFRPRYSPTGEQVALAWNRPPSQGTWLITRQPYAERLVRQEMLNPLGWAPDGRSIYVMAGGGGVGSRSVSRVELADGQKEVLITLPGEISFGSVDPTGTKVVVAVVTLQSDVFVVENFDRRQD